MITLTETACTHFRNLLADDDVAIGIRFYVKGMGCSGMTVECDFATSCDSNDTLSYHGAMGNSVSVYIDEMSAPYLEGMTVDYVREGLSQVVKLNIPKAKSHCGCGNSFNFF